MRTHTRTHPQTFTSSAPPSPPPHTGREVGVEEAVSRAKEGFIDRVKHLSNHHLYLLLDLTPANPLPASPLSASTPHVQEVQSHGREGAEERGDRDGPAGAEADEGGAEADDGGIEKTAATCHDNTLWATQLQDDGSAWAVAAACLQDERGRPLRPLLEQDSSPKPLPQQQVLEEDERQKVEQQAQALAIEEATAEALQRATPEALQRATPP